MNSSMLKHQAKLQEWAIAVQECRTSGRPVRHWCKEKGITATTYYRWEREILSIAGNSTEKKLLSHLQNCPLRNSCVETFQKVPQHFRSGMAVLRFTRN